MAKNCSAYFIKAATKKLSTSTIAQRVMDRSVLAASSRNGGSSQRNTTAESAAYRCIRSHEHGEKVTVPSRQLRNAVTFRQLSSELGHEESLKFLASLWPICLLLIAIIAISSIMMSANQPSLAANESFGLWVRASIVLLGVIVGVSMFFDPQFQTGEGEKG
jgi:hypothetical protein